MHTVNRRTFVQLSTGALLTAASSKLTAAVPSVTSKGGILTVKGPSYTWEYTVADDSFQLFDAKHRPIVGGKLQPAVIVAQAGNPTSRLCTPGKPLPPQVEAGKITFFYEGVNATSGGSARITSVWRFDETGIWTDAVLYDTPQPQEIVSLHYFTHNDGTHLTPTLHPTFLIAPGIISGSAISPILHDSLGLNQDIWLGRGSSLPGILQQWALPVHFFGGFSTAWSGDQIIGERNVMNDGRSDAFILGLANLPGGDYFLQLHGGELGPWIDYRSDLWHHLQGPGKLTLGATLFWAIGRDPNDAITAYYQGLLHAGIIHRKQNSPRKTQVALAPEFCTWGAQRVRGKRNEGLDEAFLEEIYKEFKESGMNAALFSIDDKWEGTYGNLVHDTVRLPHFEQFLDQLRADGKFIGVWAAIMRCENPSDFGLTEAHMLRTGDGKPFLTRHSDKVSYYILDFTQPEVVEALTKVVRRFMRRYKPDLFKFDFGYELPSVSVAAPKDMRWSGERMMAKGLEVVLSAMRAENPDLVVMYYNLSPLFLEYFDLHSTDDMFMDFGDYDVSANTRIYFSSLMGQFGVPTYGSTGYDWSSAPSIWFDSAAVGTIGSLNDFQGDEEGESSTPELIARYNGITHVLRSTTLFDILPLDSVPFAPGAHARSWARFEDGQLVLLAQRAHISGEGNLIAAARPVDPRVKDVLRATAPVIVASKTNQAISRSGTLAIVSYAETEITLKREQGREAKITHHYFGGATTQSAAKIANNQLIFRTEQNHPSGKPLEWIEVNIA